MVRLSSEASEYNTRTQFLAKTLGVGAGSAKRFVESGPSGLYDRVPLLLILSDGSSKDCIPLLLSRLSADPEAMSRLLLSA